MIGAGLPFRNTRYSRGGERGLIRVELRSGCRASAPAEGSGKVCIVGEKIANGLLLMRRFRSGCLFIPRLRFGRRRGGLCSSRLRAELGSRSRRGSGLGSAALLIPGLRSGCPFGAMGAVMFGGLLSVREREGGYSPFSAIEFDADDKKSLFREFRASFLLYSRRNCP